MSLIGIFLTRASLYIKWKGRDLLFWLGHQTKHNRRKGDITVLCFHGLCHDQSKYINSRFLKIGHFRILMRKLKEHYHILSLQEFIDGIFVPDKLNVLITFDDGYRNLKYLMLPVIKELNIPVTLFINSCKYHWMDYLDIISAKNALNQLSDIFPPVRSKSEKQIKAWAKVQNPKTVLKFKSALQQTVSPFLIEYQIFHQLLTKTDLEELNRNPLIDIANHSANHLSYSSLNAKEAIKEAKQCENYIGNINSKLGKVFAYPFGHYNLQIQNRLFEAGYKFQFVLDALPGSNDTTFARLVIHPHISINNQMRAIEDGKYI